MKYLITYDVSEDSRRNKLVKLLNEHGKRVQYSCFEIEIYPQNLELLIFDIKKIINSETDRVYIFPISKGVYQFIKKIGKRLENDDMVL
ncbi:CRISPR-associated protein Cas2 [Balnearium lithotrophicum]|uniref:CRISPR-associated endoribonuclease Cas2 n=1 Tax=Balnearium lithotrophicum TaxID=223788 RepID=A0A521DHX4_9BACT|nr:CRISPR-associated endonuclease Cas2 [Balnearium lithotrophicum]SMO71246.1 CRISPR-associated protein Cas2 [Balnearium lithotrophicum]